MSTSTPKNKTTRILLTVMGGVGILIIAYFIYSKSEDGRKSESLVAEEASIAVLPFVNMSGDPEQEYFSDGLTDGIINSLAHLKGLKVSASNSSFKFREQDVDLREVGKKLGVRTVLEGSVERQGDRIRITTQLINVENDFLFWTEQYDEKLEDIFTLQDKIANVIAEKLKITLLTDGEIGAVKPPVNKLAVEAFLKGYARWNLRTPPDLKKAIDFFQQAIQLDSSYASAYAGLADSYTALGYGSHIAPQEAFLKAKEAAVKALALDSTLAGPHASLGFYNFYYAWDWETAEQEFRMALALNPNYALAYDWYGYYLTAMERYDEAAIILQKAGVLDPLSVPIHTDMGFSLYYGRQYEEAEKKLKASIEMNPRFGLAHLWLGRVYQQQKMYGQAIQEYKNILSITPDWPVALAAIGNVYGISGDKDKAKNILKKLDSLSSKKFVTPYGVALVYAGLNEKNNAFEWLNKAYEGRSHWLVWLKTDPRWSSIRKEKQFAELVSKIGLPHE